MEVTTLTTSDRSLLDGVRATLKGADSAFLCVAFVHERGLHLLRDELEALQQKRAPVRLLVTTVFEATTASALSEALRLGLNVRTLNPGASRTFHPKLYLARRRAESRAVIGSANLTRGLATNLEAGVRLLGEASDLPLRRAWDWAESLWADPRAEPWTPSEVAEASPEPFAQDLYVALRAAVAVDPVFRTLGPNPRPNRVVELNPSEAIVQTQRSKLAGSMGEPIPAWMFNLAWDTLKTHGRLTNRQLLDDLRVHRSSAVCAMLARVPGVSVAPGRAIELRWGS